MNVHVTDARHRPDRRGHDGGMNARITLINPERLHKTPGYHHVTIVEAGRTAYLAGQCPLGLSGDLVGEGDLDAQIDQVAANSCLALAVAGAGPEDVVRSVIYVVSDETLVLAGLGPGLTPRLWLRPSARPARCWAWHGSASEASSSKSISRWRCPFRPRHQARHDSPLAAIVAAPRELAGCRGSLGGTCRDRARRSGRGQVTDAGAGAADWPSWQIGQPSCG